VVRLGFFSFSSWRYEPQVTSGKQPRDSPGGRLFCDPLNPFNPS